jgi:hypothetical protein
LQRLPLTGGSRASLFFENLRPVFAQVRRLLMHKRTLLTSILLAASVASAATEVSHTRSRNETARVEYSWIENGCISKQLLVTAAKNTVRTDGTTDVKPVATLLYSLYDYCNLSNVTQTFWWGKSESFTLIVDSSLKSASFVAPAFVASGTRFSGPNSTDLGTKALNVDLRWTSNDPLDKTAGTWVTRLPGFMEVSTFVGHYRLATATGQVLDGTQNWFPVAYEGTLVQLFRLMDGETILTKE